MNTIIRSFLLFSPPIYDFIYHVKNSNLLNFYLKKVHEEDFNAFRFICEQRPQLFLDIGANAGMSALSIFLVKPNAKVISFEPNPSHYSYLEKIAQKFDNFDYKKFGLGDRNSSLKFFCPVYNGRKMTALGSFDREAPKKWLNSKNISFFDENKLKIETIEASVKTLDSLNLNPDFVKVDVEGFEHQVLLGGQETIKRCRPVFLIEGVTAEGEVYKFLKNIGYSIYKYDNGKFLPNQFNAVNKFLFPKEKLHLIDNYVAA